MSRAGRSPNSLRNRVGRGVVVAAAVLPALAGSLVPAAAAPPPAVSLGSTPNAVSFRVPFDPPRGTPLSGNAAGLRTLHWAGLFPLGKPGAPLVPTRVVRVALPPTGTVALLERADDAGSASDVRFPVEVAGDDGAGAATFTADLSPRHATILKIGVERGLRIATVAVHPVRRGGQAGVIVWARDVEVTLRITGAGAPPARKPGVDPGTRRFWAATLVNPEGVDAFGAVAAPPPPPAGGIPAVWFDDAAGWARIEITRNGITSLTRSALQGAGIPVDTVDPRTFRVFAGSLVPELPWTDLGWDTTAVGTDTTLTARWKHVYERPGFTGGFEDPGAVQEVAIDVPGESDGAFGAADRVIFYALGPDNDRDRFGLPPTTESYVENPYTDRTVYWLSWGGTFPDPPLRMVSVNAAPGGGAPTATSGTAHVHAEQNRIYVPSLAQAGRRTENWFWDLASTQSAGLRFDVPLSGAVPLAPMRAQVRFWGGNNPVPFGLGDETLHHVQLDVNGQSGSVVAWGGTSDSASYSAQDVSADGVPAANPSTFIVRVPQAGTGLARVDQVYVAWIDVWYLRSLSFGGSAGEVRVDAGAAGRTLHLIQVPEGTAAAYDVSDPRHPRRLMNGTPGGSTGSRTLDVAFDAAGAGVVALEDPASPQGPAAVALDDPPRDENGAVAWLRATGEPLDYVIVAADPFAGEAEALAQRRRAHLGGITGTRPARVRVVKLSDIMDEFGGGMLDPTAIRNFLEYVYLYYGNPAVDDRLAYCLFVGDHTYDFRNYLGTGARSWVPAWEENREDISNIASGSVQYASDDFLVRFDGPDDPYDDLAAGRLPVSSAAEAHTLITDKILASETTPVYGPWRARMLMASDDLCQLGHSDPTGGNGEFVGVIEEVNGLFPAAFDRAKVYLAAYGDPTDCSIASKPQAAVDFRAAWTAGAWLVDYVGHGNDTYLADERLLVAADAATLANGTRLPFFIATASKAGKFNLPAQDGLVESAIRAPGGGALAATGSTSNQTFSGVAYALNEDIATRLFTGGDTSLPIPMGLATLQAKNVSPGIVDKYEFFGDPAQLPPVPALAVSVTAPPALTRGSLAGVSARVAGSGGRSGTVDLRVEEPPTFTPVLATGYSLPGDALFTGTAAVTADTASLAFTVPADAGTGAGARLRAYAWGAGWDGLGAAPDSVGGTADPSADTVGPIVTFLAHPSTLAPGDELAATLQDMSGIKVAAQASPPAIEVVIRDGGGTEAARFAATADFAYDLGSHTQGTVRFPVPDLADGSYTVEITAEDTYGNRASSVEDLTVRASGAAAGITEVYAYPNPTGGDTDLVFSLDRAATVSVRIFSVSGRTVRKGRVDGAQGRNGYHWDGRDEAGDPVANGVYLVQLTAGSGGDRSKHLERVVILR